MRINEENTGEQKSRKVYNKYKKSTTSRNTNEIYFYFFLYIC
jgi:hypothetical protein